MLTAFQKINRGVILLLLSGAFVCAATDRKTAAFDFTIGLVGWMWSDSWNRR